MSDEKRPTCPMSSPFFALDLGRLGLVVLEHHKETSRDEVDLTYPSEVIPVRRRLKKGSLKDAALAA
jgi:hypothetical protein